MTGLEDFRLRAELRGHDEDVRGVCVCELGLLTGSRDKTAKLWVEDSANIGHSDYVGPIAYIAPGKSLQYPQGAVVTGSRDTRVLVWDPQAAAPVQTLEGHKWQVSDIAISADGSIISSSLDGTIRVWAADGTSKVLQGHEGPVQCVLVLPDGGLLSGGNDNTIRLWVDGKCQHTFSGHTDTVRGLSLVPGLGVVSASHDQTLRVWTFTGECIATLHGHTALVYSAAGAADGTIASASEDNTARVWRPDGTCLQVIEHPGCVWDVAFLPNGDLVTACSDFAARVWSRAPERAADSETIQGYDAGIAAGKAAAAASAESQGLPDGLTLEDASALLQPGAKDGAVKVIRENGAGVAYSWSVARHEWEMIGEVVGAPGSGGDTMAMGSKMHGGQQWDYVFDVDAEEGAAPRKLPANRGEDPYVVADRFLTEEGLPISYREQIANFVVQNSHGGIYFAAVPMNVDPFTGAGAYVPNSSTRSGASLGGYGGSSDPFTGGGAYVPGAAGAASGGMSGGYSVTGGNVDPYTGTAASAAIRAAPAVRHVPATASLVFDAPLNIEAVERKIREFSAAVAALPQLQGLGLSETEAGSLHALLSRAVLVGQGGTASFTDSEHALLTKLLQWPPAQLFPALDLARLLVMEPATAQLLSSTAGEVSNMADSREGLGSAISRATDEPQLAANLQTGLRLLCNCFRQAPLRQWALSQRSVLLDAFAPAYSSPAKAVRLGAATLLLNFSVAKGDEECTMQLLSGLAELLNNIPATEVDSQYRAVVAVGTAVHGHKELASLAADLGLRDSIKQLQLATGCAPKVKEAAVEVLALLA